MRLVARALGQAEVPRGVLLPRVPLQVGVLGSGARLHLAPVAVEDVLPRVDQGRVMFPEVTLHWSKLLA